MTRYLIAILCLVALSAGASSATVPTIYVKKNANLEDFGLNIKDSYLEKVTKCEVTNNHGTKYVLWPKDDTVDKLSDVSRFVLNEYNKCKLNVYKMTEKDEGLWEFGMTKTRGKEKTIKTAQYKIKVREIYKQVNILPDNRIEVHPDRQVAVQLLGEFDNVESCKLLSPDNIEYDIKSNELEGVKSSGRCGFKMTVTEKRKGVWTLVADLKNNTAFYSTIVMKIQDGADLKPNATYYNFKRGEEGKIVGGVNARVCFLENPHGVKLPINSGQCEHTIPSVSKSDQGVWKAHYGVNDVENLIEQRIVVHTYDVNPVNVSITRSADGDLSLLCRVRGFGMDYCMFVKPDGKFLQMSTTVSTDKYDYYGNGMKGDSGIFASSRPLDCGITIHSPTAEDYGAWKCLVGYKTSKYGQEKLGKIIKVLPTEAMTEVSKRPGKSATNVIVKRGESFKVKCTADEVLSYCWLRSPNGSVHPVFASDHDVKPPQLRYEGSGLELGDCTARVENSSKTDAGKWTCHMGVRDGPELQTSFQVTLKESHLMATYDTVYIGQDPAHLVCRPLPDSNKVIDSCRWLSPQGQGIHVERGYHYETDSHGTFCRIIIHPDSSFNDAGEWRCFARFANTLEEGSARVTVEYQSRGLFAYFSNAMVLGLLTSSTLCVFLIIMYKRRRVVIELDEKIILEKPSNFA